MAAFPLPDVQTSDFRLQTSDFLLSPLRRIAREGLAAALTLAAVGADTRLGMSDFKVEKQRVGATVILTNGETAAGWFFVALGSAQHYGPERVGEMLNSDTGFVPFERTDAGPARTVLYNREQIVIVALSEGEAQRVSGYEVARRRVASLLLSNGTRLSGAVCVYRPEGRDRISDWSRDPYPFRYLETSTATVLVNLQHVVEVTETESA